MQYPQYEGNLLYDYEERDARYFVEHWEKVPSPPAKMYIYFDGLRWDERGLILRYTGGRRTDANYFSVELTFPCSYDSMRTFKIHAHQEAKLGDIMEKAGVSNEAAPLFHAYRCRYSNYYNWCMDQAFFGKRELFYHYIIIALDTWTDVFCQEEPKVSFHRHRLHLH